MEPSQSWGRGGEPWNLILRISVRLLKNADTKEGIVNCTMTKIQEAAQLTTSTENLYNIMG